MKVPTTGTSVYNATFANGGKPAWKSPSISVIDASFTKDSTGGSGAMWSSRLTGDKLLSSASTDPETSDANYQYDCMNGFGNNFLDTNFDAWMFRRAPGFFDEVCYTGTGVARTVAHNLAAVPELMIVKSRSTAGTLWLVYSATLGNTQQLQLESTTAAYTQTNWNNTTPTSSVFSVGTSASVNQSGLTYVAYLFATCPGVSKVFSYTGNGSSQTINCGFTGGARLVIVKRTDSTGNWLVVDTARGLVSGNDPTLYLNSTAAEVTGIDWIDPDSSGFIVNQESTMNANVNGGSYIGFAVA
jgi:hypothetical protein